MSTSNGTASNGTTSKEGTGTEALRVSVRPDGVARLCIDVPGAAVNTLKASFAQELTRALDQIIRDPAVKAAIFVSGKPDGFIAGADIDELAAVQTASAAEALSRRAQAAGARIAASPKPIVAAVHGPALGGGFEVALACQGRVLSNDRRTALGLPEAQLGVLPGMDGLQRLAGLAGLETALELGLSGKSMRPVKAKRLGVADDVVDRAILEQVAAELALALAEGRARGGAEGHAKGHAKGRAEGRGRRRGAEALKALAVEKNALGRALLFRKVRREVLAKTGGHYPAQERILDVLEVFANKGLEASREVEAKAFGELLLSTTARRLIEVFRAQTALKKDAGVDAPGVAPRRVERVSVLGAGLMGAGIAYVTIAAGVSVRLKDRDDAALGRGLKAVAEILDGRVKRRQMTQMERTQALGLLTTTTDDSAVAGADLIIEAVFEDLDLKRRILSEVEGRARPDAIFASNTSSIPIAQIAAGAKRPENVVGMHYFSPVHRMPLLEVVRTKQTAPEVVATAVAVGKKQGKTVIVVNDGVGFYTSRILGTYMNEAAWLVTEGASIDAIDAALVAWGWPVGPMALLDKVGLDVAAHVGQVLRAAFGDRIQPPPAVERLVTEGRKGKKNERGKAKITPEEIQMRCSLQLVNEALHCLGEGVLRSARDGDIGAIFGLGFPPFRGGPFRYVDSLGAGEARKRIEAFRNRFGARWEPAPLLVEMARQNRRFY